MTTHPADTPPHIALIEPSDAGPCLIDGEEVIEDWDVVTEDGETITLEPQAGSILGDLAQYMAKHQARIARLEAEKARLEEELEQAKIDAAWFTWDDYEEEAMRTAGDLDEREMLVNGALGIAGEAGEVADLIKKHLFHGHPLDPIKVARELGDVLWYVALLAVAIGWRLEDIARANVAKLKSRYPDGFDPERSKARESEVAAVGVKSVGDEEEGVSLPVQAIEPSPKAAPETLDTPPVVPSETLARVSRAPQEKPAPPVVVPKEPPPATEQAPQPEPAPEPKPEPEPPPVRAEPEPVPDPERARILGDMWRDESRTQKQRILAYIDLHGPVHPNRVAAALGIKEGSTKAMVNRLAKENKVVKISAPTKSSPNRSIAQITPKGSRLFTLKIKGGAL